MSTSVRIKVTSPVQWVTMAEAPASADVIERCNTVTIQQHLAGFGELEVVSATVNTTGQADAPRMPGTEGPPIAAVVTGLPDFCDVRVHHRTPGGHVAHITVWVPLTWNRRFLGTGGGGNRTTGMWFSDQRMRIAELPVALRNGFATASTDAGNRDPRFADWGLDEATRKLDRELVRNWAYRGTHDMTVVGKAVTEAIHGSAPEYSYFQGESGGGRQALMEAQRYPDDYDGIWSADPAINWTKMIAASMWPALVMKEARNPIPAAKFNAFRAGATAALDGVDGLDDGIVGATDLRDYDPHRLVGTATSAGTITTADADVVQQIWAGPTTPTGKRLWFGLRPDTESWGENLNGAGLCQVDEVDGELVISPFVMPVAWFGGWLLRDPSWDWTTLTHERYLSLFDQGVREFAEVATDDPDLSRFRDSGGKLLLTHAGNDEVIFPEGTIDYYRRVQDRMDGADEVATFARLFLSPGDGHGHCTGTGPGLTLAAGMVALMEWVENGTTPESIVAHRFTRDTAAATMTRPLLPYAAG
ncbi:tannase/feruloyl esterase family alpha/beta hydrolase [Promicromonospora sukumoe]|uniref:Feruloyl esterase n=1 Tax=Promicromonospora sukumoe TaxID=88382 RepID=A0A7W3J7D1_9MICO|nr:tannase/feruloyl esterase family alpha/beta hydrolase [Promicromonospora sukumoe]MBA8807677.1 hypothetical protein [Promicromonospora sukumoe]